MLQISNKTLQIISILLISSVLGCCPESSTQSILDSNEPLIDFRAIAVITHEEAEFNQVLLKIKLLNANTDIVKYGISTPEEHQFRLNYYRVDFKHDIKLISQGDTIPCYDLHVERLFMDLPYMNFVATFHHPIAADDAILIHDVIYTNKDVLVAIDQNEQTQ